MLTGRHCTSRRGLPGRTLSPSGPIESDHPIAHESRSAIAVDPSDFPVVSEVYPVPDVESALVRLASQPHSLLLDSALRDPRLGRYSFLTADPFEFFAAAADE